MAKFTEIELLDGTVVRVRPVPPFIAIEALSRNPALKRPPIPLVKVEGVAGIETVAARPGEEAYEQWTHARQAVEEQRNQIMEDLSWAWGIVSWRLSGKKAWESQPPDDWEYPELLSEFGFEPREGKNGRRLDYIRFELFQTNDDVERAQLIMYGAVAITPEEEQAAAELFPG